MPQPTDLNLTQEFTVVDNVEAILYFRRATNSQFDAGTPVAHALRRAATKEEIQRAGASLATTVLVWDVWTAEVLDSTLGSTDPKINDRLRDSFGAYWAVFKAERVTLRTRWRITAAKERN